ncbi:hypothetical protein NC99_07590 [Sunxiuqinia dokdonensis]|uniref:Uncharacterized protein n=1 Tax=Sunxiuqinia dokdonensis TaxID=1409788 RepID=A0A0L8VDL2_9BACT|nr:hypothetical protein NC99_07590 [Sunxiuqinia dokdonensis]
MRCLGYPDRLVMVFSSYESIVLTSYQLNISRPTELSTRSI